MNPQTENSETPQVSTEPQRLALDAMSRELVEKLNRMVEEQNQRVEAFTQLEHSLARTPMQFTLPTQPPAPTEPAAAPQQPAAAQPPQPQTSLPPTPPTPPTQPTPPLPPVPPTPPVSPKPPVSRRSPKSESSSQARTLSESLRENATSARGSAREPGSLDDLLELLGLRRAAKAGAPQRREKPTPAASEGSGMGKAFATFFLLVILFMIIRSCS
ncbi:MAG TPA: hypothetical protein H9862_02940 [Candidatus Akkermansia intestinigallinarum]|uniref:Uncharacterized protein n=1 Tax=Candidatus Akkermansia intestinigallinarum TaxID=2838431 RepID=A0A9D1VAK1_9BACT|nr:hypothetical protein [Candidatus Akkermansia intestinigallinarum]